jgi:hypothetical protein
LSAERKEDGRPTLFEIFPPGPSSHIWFQELLHSQTPTSVKSFTSPLKISRQSDGYCTLRTMH